MQSIGTAAIAAHEQTLHDHAMERLSKIKNIVATKEGGVITGEERLRENMDFVARMYGMRDRATAEAAYAAGASRVVIGTRAATDPAFLREMARAHGPRLAVGIDAKDGLVAVKGWTAVTALKATEFAKEAGELGVSTVIYTDIATDGMLTGPNWHSLEAVLKACPCGVIASGGVSGTADVARLAEMAKAYPNLVGAIVGEALYEGRCDVAGLLKATGER